MTPTRHDHSNKVASVGNKITNTQSAINDLLTIYSDDFIEAESTAMLQADIVALEHRQQILEREIFEALRHIVIDDPMIADLKSRVLFIREQIDVLREEAQKWYR